jgi:zinc-binding alcohol dehydrogenase family protein
MKAIGFVAPGPIDRPDALLDLELPLPQPLPHDVRVKVAAVSVNPVDTKMRKIRPASAALPEVLGFDAVGMVDAVGSEVTQFVPGERVFYAGAINRPGSNAEYQLVDARLVGHAPKSLSDTEAAALPLTTITAWELLFDRLGVEQGGGQGQRLLVIGGAGGVGSILIQLARQLTGLTIIASASRSETANWCRELGAHHVIDHSQAILPQLHALGLGAAGSSDGGNGIDYTTALTQTHLHWAALTAAAAPQGKIALIDDPASMLDIMPLKRKAVSLHWESMFTRSLFQTPDMAKQGQLLSRVAELVDAGRIRSTLAQTMSPINAANLRAAHALLESGTMRGKVVLEGF